jgi:hypothetical protein
MRISILQGTATGTSVYTETQNPSTNANGLIAIEIGTGIVVSGSFSNIDWANGPYFVKTETDPNGGSNYTLTGTSQLLSVPYALHAKTAEIALNGVPSGSQHGQILTNCDGNLTWTYNGQCLWPQGTVFCSGTQTAVVPVTNPITGKTWMDRNLGAARAATSSSDTLAYGDLYQWGRAADGHQCRKSSTTSNLSSTDQPNHAKFILSPNTPYHWSGSINDNLWQGVNGINNPCPSGYRVPTNNELIEERNSWTQSNSFGAFNSALKLTLTGARNSQDGALYDAGANGWYRSSTFDGANAVFLYFGAGTAVPLSFTRALGITVRCIKD